MISTPCPQRRGTDCEKWDLYDEDVLPLWVADMDFRSPEPVIRTLAERVEHGFFGYPNDYTQVTELRQAIIDWTRTAPRLAGAA